MRSLMLATVAALAGALPAQAQDAPALPIFDAATFATPGRNPRFPLVPGTVRVFVGTDSDGVRSRDRVTVLGDGAGPVLLGVSTVAVLNEEWEDGVLLERAMDYVAVDAAGNVWQMGEDNTNFRYDAAGALTGTDPKGTWLAGAGGAEPGILLSAEGAAIGIATFKEHAPANDAMNWIRVDALDVALDGPAGPYAGVARVFESSTLEADAREYKYYAPGVGLVRVEDGLSEKLDAPASVSELQP